MLLQALNEELYDIIQVSPEEKPVAVTVKNMHRQQNPASEQPPTRPPKNNRTLKVNKVNKIQGGYSHYTEIVIIAISKLTLRTRLVL